MSSTCASAVRQGPMDEDRSMHRLSLLIAVLPRDTGHWCCSETDLQTMLQPRHHRLTAVRQLGARRGCVTGGVTATEEALPALIALTDHPSLSAAPLGDPRAQTAQTGVGAADNLHGPPDKIPVVRGRIEHPELRCGALGSREHVQTAPVLSRDRSKPTDQRMQCALPKKKRSMNS